MKRHGRIIALAAALSLAAFAVAVPMAAAQPTEPWKFYLDPEVQPGGRIRGIADIKVCKDEGGVGPVTSSGFTEPLVWGRDVGAAGASQGSTTVIQTPGKYVATAVCLGNQRQINVEFTILGEIPTTTTPPVTTEPPAPPTTPKPAPKPPIKKPKGAPETGGGGTA